MKNVSPKLFFTNDFERSLSEIKETGGHVAHILSGNVFVAYADESNTDSRLMHSSAHPWMELDKASLLLAKIWQQFENRPKLPVKRKRSREDKKSLPGLKDLNNSKLKIENTQQLAGLITVAIVVVSGPNEMEISRNDYVDITGAVFRACHLLQTEGGTLANLTFRYQFYNYAIDAAPGNVRHSMETCEAVFRDPALAQLGYGPGNAGCQAFVTDLKTKLNANRAYMAFITRYPVYSDAYSGTEKLCIQYGAYTGNELRDQFMLNTCAIFDASPEKEN